MKSITMQLTCVALLFSQISCKTVAPTSSSLLHDNANKVALPEEPMGSMFAFTTWVKKRLYQSQQHYGQTDLKGDTIRYAGDQYSFRIPADSLTVEDALLIIQELRDRPNQIYSSPTKALLGWPNLAEGETLSPGQVARLKPQFSLGSQPVIITSGAESDPFSYGVFTADLRGTHFEREFGQVHMGNGIREWGFRKDVITGDWIFINRAFYKAKTDVITPELGTKTTEFFRMFPMFRSLENSSEALTGAIQKKIWDLQQKDIIAYLKMQYDVNKVEIDNKTFEINVSIPRGIRLSTTDANDWDLRLRNSIKLISGKPFLDDVPR